MAMSLNLFLADKLSPLVLATQPKLLSVNLTNNLISDVQPGAFANMTRLVRLILTKNKIGKLEEGSLQGSHTLLSPLGLQASDRGTSPLSPFTSVLNNPPISGLVNLVELDLSNNFLTKVPMVALAALNNLKFLNLGSNKIQVMLVIVIPGLQFSTEQRRKTHWLGFLSCQPSQQFCVAKPGPRCLVFVRSHHHPSPGPSVRPHHHLADRPCLDHWSSGLPIKLPHPPL